MNTTELKDGNLYRVGIRESGITLSCVYDSRLHEFRCGGLSVAVFDVDYWEETNLDNTSNYWQEVTQQGHPDIGIPVYITQDSEPEWGLFFYSPNSHCYYRVAVLDESINEDLIIAWHRVGKPPRYTNDK